MESNDLRVQKTKKALKDTFKSMFLATNFENITIKELCNQAMVNRRTFYLHYNSIDDILNEILEELATEFSLYTNGYDHFANPERIVKDYFIFTNDRPLFEKMNINLDYNYIREIVNDKVKNIATDNFKSIMSYNEFTKNMISSYLNSATVNMYKTWVKDGKKVPIEEAIKIASKLVKNGITSIIKENQ